MLEPNRKGYCISTHTLIMQSEIICKPSYSLLELRMSEGEAVQAEPGAMVYMKGVELKTEARGGLLGGLKRMIGGESFFVNRYQAVEDNAILGLAPKYQGDIVRVEVRGRLLAQSGAFLAGADSININDSWGGAKTFFAGEGLILLSLEGDGDVFLSSFGGIVEKEVEDGFVVDTGHIVAFEESLDFEVRRVGGLKETFLSGEGLVAEFAGEGKLWLQTRSIGEFVGWLASLMPRERR